MGPDPALLKAQGLQASQLREQEAREARDRQERERIAAANAAGPVTLFTPRRGATRTLGESSRRLGTSGAALAQGSRRLGM